MTPYFKNAILVILRNITKVMTMTYHILCVEDNKNNANIIRKILLNAGYEISFASEGNEAIKMAKELQPDLILMDLHLPGMNGLDTTLYLKGYKPLADIPIIALTADIYSETMFLEAGCDVYMSKPIRRKSLLQTVMQVLTETGATQAV